jgi:hypothetical protein
MKVGVTAFHAAYNYGSALLTYALKTTVDKLGYEGEVIDFIPTSQKSAYRIIKPWTSPGPILQNLYVLPHYKSIESKMHKYSEFRKKHMNLTEREYNSVEELMKSPPECDAYICGSDQIWNPNAIDFDKAYFLPYGKKEVKRISYAPSLGPNMLTSEQKGRIKEYIKNIDVISAREREGQEILNELTEKKIEVLIDPAMLLESSEWDEIAIKPNINKPYILCYFIGNGSYLRDFAENLRKKTNLPIVVIMPNWRDLIKNYIKCYDAGPQEFLGMISNAEYICTNSFHATIFSVLYKKKFFVGSSNNKKDARLETLLGKFNLKNRLIKEEDIKNINLDEVNFDKCEEVLATQREKSISFLKLNLQKNKPDK